VRKKSVQTLEKIDILAIEKRGERQSVLAEPRFYREFRFSVPLPL
jgi:hypothetical protein